MCGRYTLTNPDIDALARVVAAELSPGLRAEHRPRFNIAPGQRGLIVRETSRGRVLELARWGLPSPHGAGRDLINARAETAAALPTFRDAMARGRCGVLADGFYEWTGPRAARTPLWFHPHDRQLLVFAGLLREDLDPDTGEILPRFVIMTSEANAVVAPHHARMPAIVPRGSLGRWLAPLPRGDASERATLARMLAPAPPALLTATPVSPRVGDVRFDDPQCLSPA